MEGQNALCAQLTPSTLDGSVAGLSDLDVDCTQKHHTSHHHRRCQKGKKLEAGAMPSCTSRRGSYRL